MLRINLSLKPYLILILGTCLILTSACTRQKPTEYALYLKQLKENKIKNETVVDDLVKQNNTEPEEIKPIQKPKAVGIAKKAETPLEKVIKEESVWLLIDTQGMRLEVKRGNKTLATFNHIAIGRNGAGFKNRRGDNITPIGTYKIGWINDKSVYHTFYGFTYPSVENAKTALEKGLVSQSDYNDIVTAHQNDQIPPQNTSLGGRIGLHGIGQGDEKMHEMWNWTHGCVAVTNEEIDALSQWIYEGITVKVK
ncbi:MAG: L,D-transpeptidase family protein [Methylococcaceae bacterium]|nr:L,D-transpeptidase family protein [Methylococcaceae bacterium]